MSTTTTFDVHSTAATSTNATPRKSFVQSLIEGRERQGKERVKYHLARMSNDQLSGLGFSTAQIEEIRVTGTIPASFWR